MEMEGRPISFTVAEWQRVQSLFNSDSLEDLKECHIILTAWNHRIPMVAVVCCEMVVATLIGAKLEMPPEFAYMKLDTMRRQCAIAVIRFVNYINEMGQPGVGGRHLEMKRSVLPFGVPAWMVDMRHEATHNELPILERLQIGVAFARKWLWDNFWTRPVHEAMKKAVVRGGEGRGRDPNEIEIGEGEGEGEEEMRERAEMDSAAKRRETRMTNLMLQFIEWRSKKVTFEMSSCGMMDRPPLLISIENALLQEPYDLFKVLISDGFLILSAEQLAAFKQFDPCGAIPPRVQMFWDPIVTMTFENTSMFFFIDEMMERLLDPSTIQSSRSQLITWITMFMDSALGTKLLSAREWSSLLSSMVALPGVFHSKYMQRVMDQIPELEEKRRGQVRRIMDISIHDEDGNLMEDSMTVRTIDDLKKAIQSDLDKPSVEAASRGVWSRSAEKEWRSTPLGMVPSQRFSSFSLIVDDSMLAKWEIVPSGQLNLNAVYDAKEPTRNSVPSRGFSHGAGSTPKQNSAPSGSSAPSTSSAPSSNGGSGKKTSTTFAKPTKVGGKRKSREGASGGEDSFIESMQRKKKKKKEKESGIVTID